MLMESPSAYWFFQAFYYFRATDEEAVPSCSSFPPQSMFKFQAVNRSTPSSFSLTQSHLGLRNILNSVQLTPEFGLRFPL